MIKDDQARRTTHGRPEPTPAGARRLLPVAISASGGRMLLHFAAIAEVLMRMHGIPSELKDATKSRLKYFQNRHFPLPSSRQGKARIGMDDAMKLVFAFELLQAGMGPLRALRLTATDWPMIREAIAAAWWRSHGGGGEPFDLAIAPNALAEMNAKDEPLDTPLTETLGSLRRTARPRDATGRTLLIVDVGAMALTFGEKVTTPKLAKPGEFDRAMLEYCADTFGSENPATWRPRPVPEAPTEAAVGESA